VLFFAPLLRRRDELNKLLKVSPFAIAAAVPFLLLTLLQNKAVTQNWFELPEQLSQYQYGVPTSLTFQPAPVPHVPLTPQQEQDYKAQTLGHGLEPDSLSRFLLRLEFRVRYYRFFFLPALYVALVAFLFTLRKWPMIYAACALAIFALGTNLFPYLLVHYLAGVTSLFVLVAVAGLVQLGRIQIHQMAAGEVAVKIILLLCAAQFLLWYGAHLFEGTAAAAAVEPYETWDMLPHGDPHGRVLVNKQLAGIPGKLVVLVRYSPQHVFQNEWVWNGADIDGSRIVWARDLGETENGKLIAYYPDRAFWVLRPDDRPPALEHYAARPKPVSSPFEEVH